MYLAEVFENITKVFNAHSRNRNKVLKGVSFTLPDKGLVAIFGKSGSGKTTLLNIIGGLEKQDGGKVYIGGECTDKQSDKIRNERIGFIFQNYYLEKGYTIAEIMRNQMLIAGFKDEKEIQKRTTEALALVDMERYKNKQGDALSGGQKQRVAIARALIKGGDVILADEPTGNLDFENTHKVMSILKKISENHLVVLVTHELSLIKTYADSYIELVDGEIKNDTSLDEQLKELPPETNVPKVDVSAPKYAKSGNLHNGRLFTLRSIYRMFRGGDEERVYSAANIFKQVFVAVIAVVMCFLSLMAFETATASAENKSISSYSVYTDLNAYSDLRMLDESLYEDIDFFETQMREGQFSYSRFASLSGITENYTPRTIRAETYDGLYGKMPNSGEVLITRNLAEKLKQKLQLDELNNDGALLSMLFENDYRVSGIIDGNSPAVYFNKTDYINFLGVLSSTSFNDRLGLFFSEELVGGSFTTEICIADDTDLADNQVVVEVNRNSLYKMMNNSSQADYIVEGANQQLKIQTTAIYISGSKPMYVKCFEITRDVMTTDIRLHLSQNVIDNVFVYLSPNLDSLGTSESGEYYFEINAADEVQLASLTAKLSERGISKADILGTYKKADAAESSENMNALMIILIIAVLLLFIYFFIEKSGSLKNSKEYGIYRAIGVNKGNLLFKEAVLAVIGNLICYLIVFAVTLTLMCVRYGIMNVAFSGFIGLSIAIMLVSALLMIGISIIPYLFVLRMSPAKILARYDI